jgi:SAM-dependent methyltransferase
MGLERSVEPEWLDELSADDRRAVRARRDLKRLNAVILQAGLMTATLSKNWGQDAPRTLLDLGCGDGTFMLQVARRLAPRWRGVAVTLLDRQSIVSDDTRAGFVALGWKVETKAADVLDYLDQIRGTDLDIITANLFLHHFPPEPLRRLLDLAAQSTRLLVACEPRRTRFALRSSRLLWAIGCNDVSLHDSIVSVRAGFSDRELSALWPRRDGWELQEEPARLFAHRFVARRR